MSDLEALVKYGWYAHYGTRLEQSVRQTAEKLGFTKHPVCDMSTSHFEMSLDDMLTRFEAHVRCTARRFRIDGRAIAGAIAWEYEQNSLRGRLSDYVQFNNNWWGGRSIIGGGNLTGPDNGGIGWGSIHTDAALKVRRGDPAELQCLRMEAEKAITLVAQIIDRAADRYFRLSEGVWVRDNPAVLAMLFNTSDAFVERSAVKRINDPGKQCGIVALVISENRMALWVHQNLCRFARFRTCPCRPHERYYRVKASIVASGG